MNHSSVIDEEFDYILRYAESSDFDYDFDNIVTERLRILWTAYCLHKNLDADTYEYDSKLAEIWGTIYESIDVNSEIIQNGSDLFENYMTEFLV